MPLSNNLAVNLFFSHSLVIGMCLFLIQQFLKGSMPILFTRWLSVTGWIKILPAKEIHRVTKSQRVNCKQ